MKSARPEAGLWRGLEILVVSPTPTHPQDHGNRKRIFELCSELKRQGAKIHFVHYASEHDWRSSRPSRWEKEMIADWDSYQLVAPSRPLHEPAIGPDHLIDEWSDPSLSAYIRWTFTVRAYDVVLVEYTWMSFCFDSVPNGVFKICDTHDVFGGRRKILEANGIAAEFFHTTPEEEKRGLERADMIWAIKESERSYFDLTLGLKDCLTMLYGEPARGWWRPRPLRDGWLRVGIMGARNNVNRFNLEAFIAVAFPVFESYMAPVKLVIAGGCSVDFKDWRHPNLEVMGRVPEVADFYKDMDVICAPIQFSTGLKIKVAEALGSGAPVVALAHAMEGFPTTSLLHLLPDFPAMARELVKLAFDPSALPELAAKSVVTTQKIQSLVTQTLEHTRQRIVAKGAKSIVIVTSLEAFESSSLLHDHLYSTLNYFRFAGFFSLYIVGRPVKFDANVLSTFGFTFVVFVSPELAGALGDALPESWRPLDLASMLKNLGIERAYFLASDPQLSRIWPGLLRRAFVRYDAIELSGQNPREIIELLRTITSVTVISSTAIGMPADGISAVYQIPFRRKNGYTSLANRVHAAGAWRGLLVLTSAEDFLVVMLRELAERLGIPIAVLNVCDPAAIRTLAASSDGADPRSNVAGARLIVDLSSGSAVAAVVLEGGWRAGIPVIRFLRGTSAVSLQQFRHAARPATIGALIRSVATGLTDGAARSKLIEVAHREVDNIATNDAGWTLMWHDLTQSDPEATVSNATDALFG
jgi:glycosyltransferase involved in cell wall biosynthesis